MAEISKMHDEKKADNLRESPSFTEMSNLEKEIYSHFENNKIIEKELNLDNVVLFNRLKEEILNTLTTENLNTDNNKPLTFDNLTSVQKFIYEDRTKSPLYIVPRDHNHLLLLSQIPHNHKLWNKAFKLAKQNKDFFTVLWMLVQIQTVHMITHIHKYPTVIRNALEFAIGYSRNNKPKEIPNNIKRMYLNSMQIGTVNNDCIVTALKMKKLGYNPIVLNCANQDVPAAAKIKYSEEGTQEENIFKRTTIYLSLWPHKYSNPLKPIKPYAPYDEIWNIDNEEKKDSEQKKYEIFYPMDDKYGGIYSKNVLVFRGSEQSGYELLPLNERAVISFISVAAEAHGSSGLVDLNEKEIETYKHKIRSIYRISFENGHDCLVLGAMGCGAFGNPPGTVAKLFYDVLINEFNGCFQNVIFAILWDHNSTLKLVQSFMKYFPQNDKLFRPKKQTTDK
eukprot:133345_1